MIKGEVAMGEKIWASGIEIDTSTGAVEYTLLQLLAIPHAKFKGATDVTMSEENTIRVVNSHSGMVVFVDRSSCFWTRIEALENVLDGVREMKERVGTLENELEQLIRKEVGAH